MFKAFRDKQLQEAENYKNKIASVKEQLRENYETAERSRLFFEKIELEKLLTAKFKKQGLDPRQALEKAKRLIESGAWVFEDTEEEEKERDKKKNETILPQHKIGYVSPFKQEIIDINKIITSYCKEHKDKEHANLKKYFDKLSKSIRSH
jgi:hypothetical protein